MSFVLGSLRWLGSRRTHSDRKTVRPQKGAFKGAVAGNSSLPKPRWVKFITTQLINSRQGSHGPLQTQAQDTGAVENTSPSATLMSAFNLSLHEPRWVLIYRDPISSHTIFKIFLLINLYITFYPIPFLNNILIKNLSLQIG
jgi:hypothetical protein